jgi:hypothetical protein
MAMVKYHLKRTIQPSMLFLCRQNQRSEVAHVEIAPGAGHQRNKRCAVVLQSRLTNHRLIFLTPLPFYDSSAASLIVMMSLGSPEQVSP